MYIKCRHIIVSHLSTWLRACNRRKRALPKAQNTNIHAYWHGYVYTSPHTWDGYIYSKYFCGFYIYIYLRMQIIISYIWLKWIVLLLNRKLYIIWSPVFFIVKMYLYCTIIVLRIYTETFRIEAQLYFLLICAVTFHSSFPFVSSSFQYDVIWWKKWRFIISVPVIDLSRTLSLSDVCLWFENTIVSKKKLCFMSI